MIPPMRAIIQRIVFSHAVMQSRVLLELLAVALRNDTSLHTVQLARTWVFGPALAIPEIPSLRVAPGYGFTQLWSI